MPKISQRGQKIPSSPIRKFVPLLQKVEKRGTKVYKLHIGQPDLLTPSQIIKSIKGFKEKVIRYTPSTGIPEIKNAWQKYYKDFGINFKSSEIAVTVGGSEAILFALLAVCDPKEEVIVFEPFYTNYNGFAAIAGARLVPVKTSVKTGFHLPSREIIEKKITKKTKAILICNPNNPTGTVYTKKELKMLSSIAKKHNLFILSDEVYREFVYDGQKHYSIMSFPQIRQNAILLDSVSKRFSACGVRIGCLASKNEKVIQAIAKFCQARLSLPQVEQVAVVSLLKNSKKYTKLIAKEYKKRRDVAFKELQKIPEAECFKPKGAFYTVVRLPVKDADVFAEWLLGKFSYKKQTIMLAPAEGFYATKGLGRDEARIAFVLSSPKLKTAINILRRGLKEYSDR